MKRLLTFCAQGIVGALVSCGAVPEDGLGYYGKEIKVNNQSLGTVEILLEKSPYLDSIVELDYLESTIIKIPYNDEFLRVRKPYGKTIQIPIDGYSVYKPLVLEFHMFR